MRWLVGGALFLAVACERSGSGGQPLLGTESQAVKEPAGLQYDYPEADLCENDPTPVADVPTSTGGAITSYSISPALPTGLTIDTTTGAISGTPTKLSALTTYTVTGTNSAGSTTAVLEFEVTALIAPSGLTFSTNPAVYGRNRPITSNSGSFTGCYLTSATVTPALPAGLTLSSFPLAVTGTPTALSPKTTYTVKITNPGGSATAKLVITVGLALPPSGILYSENPAVFTEGKAIVADTPTSGGSPVTSWSISPALPAGLAFSGTKGVVSGTPTALHATKTYIVTATNSAGSGTADLVLTVGNGYAAPCTEDSQCSWGSKPYCSCFVYGTNDIDNVCQCTTNCEKDSDCPSGFICAADQGFLGDGGVLNACVEKCSSSSSCSNDFACNQTVSEVADANAVTACAFGCDYPEDCASGYDCDQLNGFCYATTTSLQDAGLPANPGVAPAAHDDSCTLYDAGMVCTANKESTLWATMDEQPIILPNQAAGFNMGQAGFLSIAEAEKSECQGAAEGDVFSDNDQVVSLGESQEVALEYNPCTGLVDYIGLDLPGTGTYVGTLTFTNGTTTYTVEVGQEIKTKKGSTTTSLKLPWAGALAGTMADEKVFDDIYRAAVATFYPSQTEPTGTLCMDTGGCLLFDYGNGIVAFGVPSLGWYIWNKEETKPAASSLVQRMDIYYTALPDAGS